MLAIRFHRSAIHPPSKVPAAPAKRKVVSTAPLAASEVPRLCTKKSPRKEVIDKNIVERTMITAMRPENAHQLSVPVGRLRGFFAPVLPSSTGPRWRMRTAIITAAGSASRGVPFTPKWRNTGAATRHPSARPPSPPSANVLTAWLELPAACRAAQDPAGWNAATPSPESAMTTHESAYDHLNPATAIPQPPAAFPAMIIHR